MATDVKNLRRELEGRTLLVPGSRNNDSVNVCILDWCENGFADEEDAFVERALGTLREFDYDGSEVGYFEDKAHTVYQYITDWGPEGSERDALSYAI